MIVAVGTEISLLGIGVNCQTIKKLETNKFVFVKPKRFNSEKHNI